MKPARALAGLVCVMALASACATPAAVDDGQDVPASLRDAMVTPEMGSPHSGDAAPDFELPRFGGGRLRLSDMRGKPVLLHFTATWCPYCREEIAAIEAIAREVGQRAAVLLVDVKESEQRWREFGAGDGAATGDSGMIVLLDDDGVVSASYAPPRARPFLERAEVPLAGTVLIDAAGTVRLYVLADNAQFDPTLGDLRAVFMSMLPEAPPQVTVRTTPVELPAGGAAVLEVRALVPQGIHIMNDAPPEPELIPTTLVITGAEVEVGPPQWPASIPYRVGARDLPTFQGDVVIQVPLRAQAGAEPGPRQLAGTLRYQACTSSRCFMPRSAAFAVDVMVR